MCSPRWHLKLHFHCNQQKKSGKFCRNTDKKKSQICKCSVCCLAGQRFWVSFTQRMPFRQAWIAARMGCLSLHTLHFPDLHFPGLIMILLFSSGYAIAVWHRSLGSIKQWHVKRGELQRNVVWSKRLIRTLYLGTQLLQREYEERRLPAVLLKILGLISKIQEWRINLEMVWQPNTFPLQANF